ncbi:hypothetical protein [Luteolibacter sp. Populi]|uniref:hypothetical protein n=1 Tax=Luteolibacter sp. Populi TaxID=3230487 RepID=UPI0034659916
MPATTALCIAFAIAGFFGGKLSSKGEPDSSPPGGNRGFEISSKSPRPDDEGSNSGSPAKTHRPTVASAGPTSLSDSFREFLKGWNDPKLTLEDGDEREVLTGDLNKLNQLIASIGRADAADLAELKEVLKTGEETPEETEMLVALLQLPLLGREVELRGSAALEDMVEKNKEEEDEIFSDAMPMMLYTLAKQNPAEAEAWLKTFSARPDADDFTLDVDELKAVIEKSKKAP